MQSSPPNLAEVLKLCLRNHGEDGPILLLVPTLVYTGKGLSPASWTGRRAEPLNRARLSLREDKGEIVQKGNDDH